MAKWKVRSILFRVSLFGCYERRGCLAANYRGGLVDELIVFNGGYHEEGKVHAARFVAREDWVTHMPAPHGKALTPSLFQITSADDRPRAFAREYPIAGFHLISEFHEAKQPGQPANNRDHRFVS